MYNNFYEKRQAAQTLKTDIMGRWIEAQWLPDRANQNLYNLLTANSCAHQVVLRRFEQEKPLKDAYTFVGHERLACDALVNFNTHAYNGVVTYHTGAFRYTFKAIDGDETVEVLVMSAYYTDEGDLVTVACLPVEFTEVWSVFIEECDRLIRSLEPTRKVIVIGGHSSSFEPTVDWEDIILPSQLKEDLLEDVESFFVKGIDVYQRLKLKPFRKLLLAGVPGTGKTMLCNALAKWALDREYLVVYVSSADRSGPTFDKIEYALSVASDSNLPTLIILEEMDAYLHDEQKALVLNVLDGAESAMNDKGSLLVATTNYPESIDERVLKRPGRLDRIFIIPEVRTENDAEKMLHQYLGDMWQDEHRAIAEKLVGYPGAFVREVAIYALTHVAYDDLNELTFDMLERSYERLRDQIDARDDFLTRSASKKQSFLQKLNAS
jgi:hypothetical protein